MKILIVLALLFGVLSPDVAYPQWASYDCEYPEAYLHVIWRYPPSAVLPLDLEGGYFIVSYPGHADAYPWTITWYDPEDDTYHWYGFYRHPVGVEYTINGYVRNQAGGTFTVIEPNWQFCLVPDIFIPLFLKG
jgi:hypothetical protein